MDTKPIITHRLIERHIRYGVAIEEWETIRHHLIHQFHLKKCTVNNRGFYKIVPRTKAAKIYNAVLFLGKQQSTQFDVWPSGFKGALEDVLHQQMIDARFPPETFGEVYNDIYYDIAGRGNQFRNFQLSIDDVDLDEWKINFGTDVDAFDLAVIERFIVGFSSLLNSFIREFESIPDTESSPAAREAKRILKKFQTIIPLLK